MEDRKEPTVPRFQWGDARVNIGAGVIKYAGVVNLRTAPTTATPDFLSYVRRSTRHYRIPPMEFFVSSFQCHVP
jgi:hypothetical protein